MDVELTTEDRAILGLERPGLVGHTCKVIRLAGVAPGLEALRAAVARRLPAAPRLAWRLGGPADRPVWRPAEHVDVSAHVGAVAVASPLDGAGLRAELARLFVQPLDRSRPLWRMDLIAPLADGGAVLAWRLHHALADGTMAIRLAEQLLFDRPATSGEHTARRTAAVRAVDEARRRHHLADLIGAELLPALRRSPFDHRVGPDREVAVAVVPLPAVRQAARTLAGATVNDAVLAAVAGGLRSWLTSRHRPLHPLHVKVPVSLHQAGDGLGNHDSFFRIGLPLGEVDPVVRLRRICQETARRKLSHDAQDLAELQDRLGRVSPELARWSGRLQRSGRVFALNVSNVHGPDREVTVLGAPVIAMHPLVEVAQHHALRVAVTSLADRLCFGFVADSAVVRDLDVLARGVEAAANELVAAASADAPRVPAAT